MRKIWGAVALMLILAATAWGAENIAKGVSGLAWRQAPKQSQYQLERVDMDAGRNAVVESWAPLTLYRYPRDGVFKVWFEGKPNTKPVFWFYKKQFAELQFIDLDPEASLAALTALYGQPTQILPNITSEGLQRWEKGNVLIEYIRFQNGKADIWIKDKDLAKKIREALAGK